MQNYFDHAIGRNPDVDVEEMNQSDSKSKYVHARCYRWTIPLNIDATDFDCLLDDPFTPGYTLSQKMDHFLRSGVTGSK